MTDPSALCAAMWQTRMQVFVALEYETGMLPFAATTLMSKFTRRSPEMVPLRAPMPWAVWQTEQVKPVLMWKPCWFQLAFETTLLRS